MRALVEFFLKRKLVVNILLIAILILAAQSMRTATRNIFPEVDLSTMLITTVYPGASPKDVEQNVTRLLEEELEGVTGIDKFTSVSAENSSVIIVNVDIDYPDQDEVKDEVRRAVDRVTDLPEEIDERPQVVDLKSSELPILVVGVFGEADYATLRRTAKLIERDLRNIKGVAKVDKYAYRDKEFQVDLDPVKLVENYVALNDILFAIDKRNVRSTGGSLESFQTQRNILTLSEFENTDQIRDVIVRSTFTGENLRVRDVADVHEGFEDETMRTGFNGERGISLVIKKSSSTDIIRLVKRVQEYVETRQGMMPDGVKILAVNDSSVIVQNRLSIVMINGIVGFIVVIAVLIFFLTFRTSFWIAMSIPSAFGVALILMPAFGVDINAVSLAAMITVLGMLVDDSIVVSENVYYYRTVKGMNAYDAALKGTMEVFKPVLATIMTTALAFAPLLVMTGVMGRFIFVIPVVVIAALFGSFIDCFFILPNHLYHSTANLGASEQGWRGRLFETIVKPYKVILAQVLRWRYAFIAMSLLMLVFSLWWGKTQVGMNLFPPDGANKFFVYLELDKSVTFDKTDEAVHQIETALSELPKHEVDYYTARIGTDQSDPLMVQTGGEENLAYLEVTLSQISERDREADEIMAEVRNKVEKVVQAKELRFEVEKPGPPAGTPIEFHVHADNDKERMFFVNRMVEDLKVMKGVSDISTTHKIGREEYKLDIDYDLLAAAALTVNDVASTLRIAFDGIDATSIVRDNEEIKIRVRFPEQYRRNVRNVLELNIRNANGKLIPVKSFASLVTTRAESSIHHTDGDVTTTIRAQTDGVSILPQTAINRLVKKYTPELEKYSDVSFSYGGEAEKTQESMQSLMIAFIGGFIAIYLILTLLFNSLSQPVLILSAIPFGLIGVVWTFYFHGRPFSFLALIGVVGLSGVVVNDSLVMVDFINNVVRPKIKEVVKPCRELIPLVVKGAGRRLRPVIITTVTTVVALFPTAYGIGGSDPFIEPMVLAVAWGLVFATVLTLFLIPCLYLVNVDVANAYKACIKRIVRRGTAEK